MTLCLCVPRDVMSVSPRDYRTHSIPAPFVLLETTDPKELSKMKLWAERGGIYQQYFYHRRSKDGHICVATGCFLVANFRKIIVLWAGQFLCTIVEAASRPRKFS